MIGVGPFSPQLKSWSLSMQALLVARRPGSITGPPAAAQLNTTALLQLFCISQPTRLEPPCRHDNVFASLSWLLRILSRRPESSRRLDD
jgi:hypothetical protein